MEEKLDMRKILAGTPLSRGRTLARRLGVPALLLLLIAVVALALCSCSRGEARAQAQAIRRYRVAPHGEVHYVYCASIDRTYCGALLYDCDDGRNWNCVHDVSEEIPK